MSTSAGLDRFRKNFPENFIELGISEQNMIGVASALSNENHKIITTSFAPFQTMRCCEQIKVNLGYMKQKITMVGLASGLSSWSPRLYTLLHRRHRRSKINSKFNHSVPS